MERFPNIEKLCCSFLAEVMSDIKTVDDAVIWAIDGINDKNMSDLKSELKLIEAYPDEQLLKIWNDSGSQLRLVEAALIRRFFEAVRLHVKNRL